MPTRLWRWLKTRSGARDSICCTRPDASRDDRPHASCAIVTDLLLFLAALAGGALNAVAGGGSFIALPALMAAGVLPVAANATTTFAMWPASVSSVFAYRRELSAARAWLVRLGLVSLIGGLLGGWLLVRTSDARFLRLLPWLMLAAAVTFTFGGRLAATPPPAQGGRRAHPHLPWWVLAVQLAISIYGGYFGGGMGIMTLAAFAVAGMTDIHEMNALKVTLAVAINGVALAEFIANGAVAWRPGLVMVAGGVVGGYAAASYARRINPVTIRALVTVVAWVMTIYFFVR